LTNAKEFASFALRRFGRVYPLHFLFLLLLIGLELIKLLAYAHGAPAEHPPFTGTTSPAAIVTNLLLVQAFGLHGADTWNGPSWSISVEFYTYLVFGLFCSLLGRRKRLAIIAAFLLSIAGAILLYACRGDIQATYDYAFFRCLYGFFCGAAGYLLCFEANPLRFAGPNGATIVEILAVMAAVVFVITGATSAVSLLAPMVFLLAVLVFSAQRGWLSRLLSQRPFQFLGEISYTLYISHAFVLILVGQVLHLLEQKTTMVSAVDYHGLTLYRIDAAGWVSDAAVVSVVSLIVGLSLPLYRYIEQPSRNYINLIARNRALRTVGRRSPAQAVREIALQHGENPLHCPGQARGARDG
jgi:peptidoglycan/LPS O-acetylase OafA/YrhL